MTFEEWSVLSYTEQKTALVEAVLFSEEWDWVSHETLLGFFENSPEVDITVRRFVDIARLRDLFGSAGRGEGPDYCSDDQGDELQRLSNQLWDLRLLFAQWPRPCQIQFP
jgi:hypothetical protein